MVREETGKGPLDHAVDQPATTAKSRVERAKGVWGIKAWDVRAGKPNPGQCTCLGTVAVDDVEVVVADDASQF
jgi:hypothetical protein